MMNHSRWQRFRAGFSLLELMIVLALMVGLLAIAWPNMQRPLSRTTLNEAAQVLREAIDDGRHEAITTGKPIFIQMQSDQHEVRSGAFESFANDELEGITSLLSPKGPVQDSSVNEGIQDERAPRRWRLPETIVITEVNWTDSSSGSAGSNSLASSSGVEGTQDAMDSESNLNRSSKESDLHGESNNDTTFAETHSSELEAAHSDWWFPISATGQSRSASIVLYDTSIHESLTVTYASETGALEIVR